MAKPLVAFFARAIMSDIRELQGYVVFSLFTFRLLVNQNHEHIHVRIYSEGSHHGSICSKIVSINFSVYQLRLRILNLSM